jgi:SAM-dependent methyltransferase
MSICSAQLKKWFKTPLGRRLLSEELSALQQILPHLFGYHLLQIGNLWDGRLLESSRIKHRCVLSLELQECIDFKKNTFIYSEIAHFGNSPTDTIYKPYSSVFAKADALPFAQYSLDVVVLPHILEFEENPHDILREVERILIPEGHLIILGFNPMSLWGIWHWFFAGREIAPWCGKFLSILHIKDCLSLLGFELKKQKTLFFALPFQNERFSRYITFLEKIGLHWTGNFGAVYLLVAKKRVTTLTPIKSNWLTQPTLVAGAIGTHFNDNSTNKNSLQQ